MLPWRVWQVIITWEICLQLSIEWYLWCRWGLGDGRVSPPTQNFRLFEWREGCPPNIYFCFWGLGGLYFDQGSLRCPDLLVQGFLNINSAYHKVISSKENMHQEKSKGFFVGFPGFGCCARHYGTSCLEMVHPSHVAPRR